MTTIPNHGPNTTWKRLYEESTQVKLTLKKLKIIMGFPRELFIDKELSVISVDLADNNPFRAVL